MKSSPIILLGIILLFPYFSTADDFLGAPLIAQGEIVKKTGSRLEMTTGLSHDEVVAFYRESLKKHPDIKFRDWKDSTYIEDDGKLAWHSITITKGGSPKTRITIIKDNWTWILGTLIIRYIGVFMVLLALLLALSISGRIISRYFRKKEA
jgi:hypothetical protein